MVIKCLRLHYVQLSFYHYEVQAHANSDAIKKKKKLQLHSFNNVKWFLVVEQINSPHKSSKMESDLINYWSQFTISLLWFS